MLLVGAATLVAHVVAALRVGAETATLGEARLAAAGAVARGAGIAADALPLSDRFAAQQLAAVQTLLPIGDLPLVDATRWACLALGAITALLVGPIARGLGIPAPAAAVGAAVLGVSIPVLALHTGLSAAAVAAVWVTVAAACAVRGWGRAAVAAAVVGVLTAPLAIAALLALAAHLVFERTVRLPAGFRAPLGVLLALAAVTTAALATSAFAPSGGPLAGAAGPEVTTPVAVAGAAVGLLVVVLAWRAAEWLRPVLTAAALLLLVSLVPGPSRAAALLLAVPAVALATAVVVERLGTRLGARTGPLSAALIVAMTLALLAPLATPTGTPSTGPTLLTWLLTETPSDAPIRADALDRAELLAAGVPAQRLTAPGNPPADGELVLVATRPTGGLPGSTPCPADEVVAGIPLGTGAAPAVVCRTDGGGAEVVAERPGRIRLGSALADNPSLRLAPAAEALLRDGEVDPRLMLVLAAMTTAHEIAVDDFPAAELDAPAVPRRRAVLSTVDGIGPAASELLRTWFGSQQPPFVPSVVQPVGSALLIGYSAPPPAGLVPG